MANDATQTSSGVESLISRIRDQGVQAGREEADRVLSEARREAARTLEAARKEVETMRANASAEIEAEKTAAMEALRMAERDTILELRTRVTDGFERHVRRLVSESTLDSEFIRTVVLVLAGHAAKEFIKDKEARILVSASLGSEEDNNARQQAKDVAREVTLGISADMLRKGIELMPANDEHRGVRVELVGEDVEVDLSEKAISELLLSQLLPRYRAITEGVE
jgi:V/A-type H+-transporting ATPase subunit E